jgi:hypothetical protein
MGVFCKTVVVFVRKLLSSVSSISKKAGMYMV